jgi:hypothetical protein
MRSILRSSRASAFWISNCRGAILDAQHEFVMGLADEFETANRQRCRNGVEPFNAPRRSASVASCVSQDVMNGGAGASIDRQICLARAVSADPNAVDERD